MNCFVSNKLQFSNINGTVYVMAILYQKVTRFDYMDYMGGGGGAIFSLQECFLQPLFKQEIFGINPLYVFFLICIHHFYTHYAGIFFFNSCFVMFFLPGVFCFLNPPPPTTTPSIT